MLRREVKAWLWHRKWDITSRKERCIQASEGRKNGKAR
jgi:hypothetical protein